MSSEAQTLALAIVQKCSSTLSIFGSGFIFQEVVRSSQKRNKIFYRLLASMSFCDVLCSIGFFVGTWAIPTPKEGSDASNARTFKGTDLTCQIQAFFMYGALTTLNFNACLAAYYYLSIRWGWSEDKIRKIKFEWLCYLYAVGVGLAVATAPLILNYYGPANFWCSIQPSEATQNMWLLWYIPAWFNVVFVTFAMVSIYLFCVNTERKAEKYDFSKQQQRQNNGSSSNLVFTNSSSRGEQPPQRRSRFSSTLGFQRKSSTTSFYQSNRRRQSQRVAMQAFLYCLAFFLTMLFPSLTRALQAFRGETPFAILLLFMIFYPAQGFMNFLVYMRLRWSEVPVCQKLNECCRRRNRNGNAAAATNNGLAQSKQLQSPNRAATTTTSIARTTVTDTTSAAMMMAMSGEVSETIPTKDNDDFKQDEEHGSFHKRRESMAAAKRRKSEMLLNDIIVDDDFDDDEDNYEEQVLGAVDEELGDDNSCLTPANKDFNH